MPFSPDKDLDDLDDKEILDVVYAVRDEWAKRDEMLRRIAELRAQAWQVNVPPAWKQVAISQHSAYSKEIPARVTGTIASQQLQFSRTSPDDDQNVSDRSVRVARWSQAHHQWQARHAIPGKNSYTFMLDQLINKGAVCAGSVFAPHDWAGVPVRFMNGNQITAENWRDAEGQPTKDPERMDEDATAKAYLRMVEDYRKTARPPIHRRVPQTEHCYPLFVEGELLALFIIRQAGVLDFKSAQWGIQTIGGVQRDLGSAFSGSSTFFGPSSEAGGFRRHELIEVITQNKCRYYYNKNLLLHPQWGKELVTNYGFVPYVYQVGLEGGELEYGHYGTPLLDLVDSNIRMVDTLLTYQFNGIHIASFPSWYVDYDPKGDWNVVEGERGRQIDSLDFKTGTIMDFGPYKKPSPLMHPGLNPDFYKTLEFHIEEIRRLVPPILTGSPASSGYNSAKSEGNAKAILWPICDGMEAVLERLAYYDLQHVAKRTPGAVYLNLEQKAGNSGKPKNVSRIGVSADDIGEYYDITATIDRELDHITIGQFRLNLMTGGVGDDQWVWEGAGEDDYDQMVRRRARMMVMKSPQMMAAIEEEAIQDFGLQKARDKAVARQRITMGDDGTPMVKQADGRQAGPGQGLQMVPESQGPVGATLGGMNPQANPGAPNLNSQANPEIQTPSGNEPISPVGRNNRRGGRPSGAG